MRPLTERQQRLVAVLQPRRACLQPPRLTPRDDPQPVLPMRPDCRPIPITLQVRVVQVRPGLQLPPGPVRPCPRARLLRRQAALITPRRPVQQLPPQVAQVIRSTPRIPTRPPPLMERQGLRTGPHPLPPCKCNESLAWKVKDPAGLASCRFFLFGKRYNFKYLKKSGINLFLPPLTSITQHRILVRLDGMIQDSQFQKAV